MTAEFHDLRGATVRGTFFHAPRAGEIEVLDDALVSLDRDGRIASVLPRSDPDYDGTHSAAASEGRLVEIAPDRFILPGFVDLHVHAPQYPQLGKALDVPLEVWLQRHTFPLEARYADEDFAVRVYDQLVSDLLAGGTTTAVYFATLHQAATRRLVDVCLDRRQRALVGKVAMDNPAECPDYYRDASAAEALAGTRALIDYIGSHPGNAEMLVLPVVTPRFIPACTDELLEGLGRIARECGCHVQTHCSESDWQHGYVLARHGRTDTESLDRFGLLTRRTVLAHANFVSDSDLEVIRGRGSGIAHCPYSNVFFSNAVFPLKAALEKGVRVGLGTDIAGGPSGSMLDSCRMAVAASRLLEEGVDPGLPREQRGRGTGRVDFRQAFHLATAGGADVLDLPVGRFEPGCHFDAMAIDPAAPAGTLRIDRDLDGSEDILQKIVFTASRPNIAAVWVGGRTVSKTLQ
jgi:guanine deaminase